MQAADSVEITTLVDDYVNGFLPSSEGIFRSRVDTVFGLSPGKPLLAEFGWSALIKIKKGGRVHHILFDTGLGKQALLHNSQALKIDLGQIEAVVTSHGHPDHTAACVEAVSAINRDGLPLIMHPDALRKRALIFPGGERYDFPYFLDEKKLHEKGARLEKNKNPTPLAAESALVTGEIPRVTDFERGMPPNTHYTMVDADLVHDPLILDDQGLVIKVKDKGLVVVSGCAHAGIINTIKYAKEISGISKIHGVIGGFHLTGNFFGQITNQTVASMKEFSPRIVIPSHCTGLRALVKIANELPQAFVENSIGTTFQL